MTLAQDKTFFTQTMARVHTDQGRYGAAARIYRYLLERDPGRDDLRAALADVVARMGGSRFRETAAPLVAQWVRLILHHRTLLCYAAIRLPHTDRTR